MLHRSHTLGFPSISPFSFSHQSYYKTQSFRDIASTCLVLFHEFIVAVQTEFWNLNELGTLITLYASFINLIHLYNARISSWMLPLNVFCTALSMFIL
jgi:hypothetical protein